jgi:ribonuclease HI
VKRDFSEYRAFIDGASRGNPGPAGIGVLLLDATGNTLIELHRFLGKATSNQAEYAALTSLLKEIIYRTDDFKDTTKLIVHSDSELLVKQMTGDYKIKSRNIIKQHLEIRKLLSQLKFKVEFQKISREENKRAHQLANLAIGRKPKFKNDDL